MLIIIHLLNWYKCFTLKHAMAALRLAQEIMTLQRSLLGLGRVAFEDFNSVSEKPFNFKILNLTMSTTKNNKQI